MLDRRERFEQLYQNNIDPYNFRESAYEREKYSKTISAFPRQRYRCAIEAGCSIGELSRLIAARSDEFHGIDISRTAVAEAIVRNSDRSHMHFHEGELPASWPNVTADLIVLSEILYYLTIEEIRDLAKRIGNSCWMGADCVIVNYIGDSSKKLKGDNSSEAMITALKAVGPFTLLSATAFEGYRISVLQKDAHSPA